MEIERKFLIDKLPENLETFPRKEIAQGYINREPVIRIRRSDDKYILTCKGQGLMVREEFELPLTKESFEHLKPKTDGIFIEKTRYLIPYNENGPSNWMSSMVHWHLWYLQKSNFLMSKKPNPSYRLLGSAKT